MADIKKPLDELQKKLDQDRREEADLEAGLDREVEAVKPPAYKPDHATDGGII
jgi:hypothetical protein